MFKKVSNLTRVEKCFIKDFKEELRVQEELSEDEGVNEVFEKTCFGNTMEKIKYLLNYGYGEDDKTINIYSKKNL